MKITKAAILAGGRGERMIPITNLIPKPLIPIQGRPILAHQLDQLERLGVEEVYVLTGYLSEAIERFCSNFQSSMTIECIASVIEFSPAERLLASKEILGDDFLLIYCDNYILSDEVIHRVLESDSNLTFLVERRIKGNVTISSKGQAFYKSGLRVEESSWVELGNIGIHSQDFFTILEKENDLPKALEVFSNTYSCKYVELVGIFWSISNFDRFLKLQSNRKILILDRDGILVAKMPKREYVTSFSEYRPLIENWEGLRELSLSGFDFIVATNQPGVALGTVGVQFLHSLHQKIVSDLLEFGINVLAVYVCPHHWDAYCNCRKPNPGMLLSALSDFQLKANQTLYIGDDDRDLKAAEAAGMQGILIGLEHTHPVIFQSVSAAFMTITSLLLPVE